MCWCTAVLVHCAGAARRAKQGSRSAQAADMRAGDGPPPTVSTQQCMLALRTRWGMEGLKATGLQSRSSAMSGAFSATVDASTLPAPGPQQHWQANSGTLVKVGLAHTEHVHW